MLFVLQESHKVMSNGEPLGENYGKKYARHKVIERLTGSLEKQNHSVFRKDYYDSHISLVRYAEAADCLNSRWRQRSEVPQLVGFWY